MKNKKKLKKALIISGVCLVLVIGITIGLIALNMNSRRAYVQRVSDLNMEWIASSQYYYGSVVESAQQKVFSSSEKKVDEVFVSKGDTVKKGDELFQYDTRLLELSLEEKKLTVSISETSLANEQQKLADYQNIVPVVPVETEAPTEPEVSDGATEAEEQETPVEEPVEEQPVEKTYTPAEKADMIAEQEIAVRRAQTQLNSAKEALAEAQKAMDETIVTAQLDGTVKDIQNPDEIDSTAPFCTIIGSTGVTIKGYIGEFDRSSLQIGDSLNVGSFMTEAMTTAEVLTISDYPADNMNSAAGNGNQNTSYYEFTAFMDQSDGFDIGEEVRISKVMEEGANSDSIIISKAYVRTDSNGSYVLKDADGKLQRQDVKTVKYPEGDALLITEGLSPDDMIAFPYGSKGKPGLLTTTEEPQNSLF